MSSITIDLPAIPDTFEELAAHWHAGVVTLVGERKERRKWVAAELATWPLPSESPCLLSWDPVDCECKALGVEVNGKVFGWDDHRLVWLLSGDSLHITLRLRWIP